MSYLYLLLLCCTRCQASAGTDRPLVGGVEPEPVCLPPAAGTGEVCTLLHIATLSGVLSCLLRHFRASLASLPLLGQPLGALPVGTWSADSPLVRQHASNGPQQVHRLTARVTASSPNSSRIRFSLTSGRPFNMCHAILGEHQSLAAVAHETGAGMRHAWRAMIKRAPEDGSAFFGILMRISGARLCCRS